MATFRLPVLLATLTACAVSAAEPTPAPAMLPEQHAFWEQAVNDTTPNPDLVAAEATYLEARAHFQAARFVEARELVEEALRRYPPHRAAAELRDNILAIQGVRDNRLQAANTWLANTQDVRTQETAVRMAAQLEDGDRKMAAGDYAGAELAYDSVDIALRTFPYQFDFGDLPAQVVAKKLEARAKDRQAELRRSGEDRQRAAVVAEDRRQTEETALRAKVDEMLRRARMAFDRRDFKRAEVDAWNAYELDRRREDARDLYLRARRRGHEQFDVLNREDRLERLTRVHEELHKSLIPQSELLVYPEDWQRRAMRKAPELGVGREEPWMATIHARMDQVVTFEFEDMPFEDVIAFFRQVTGLNIIVAPEVYASGAAPITFRARDMRFREALKWVLEMGRLHMAIQNQAIFIADQPIAGAIALRMYDIADLVSPVRDMPARELAYASGGAAGGGGAFDLFGGAAVADDNAIEPEDLRVFLQENVAPDQWDGEGVAIEVRGTTLFVSQTPEIHALVVALLDEQRNQSKLQVNVSVRLLDIRKGFFEEIGFDYHNLPAGMVNASSGFGVARQNQTSFHNGALNQNLPGTTTGIWDVQSGFPGGGGQFNRGLAVESTFNGGGFFGQTQINAIFSAVEMEADAQILQHPTITCFNNQRAHAAFMNQYAYISDYGVVNNNLDPVIDVLTFGDILDVRPVVSSDRKYITMEIRPSSVTLVGVFVELITAPRIINTGGAGLGTVIQGLPFPIELPNVQVRTLRSTVMLPDKGSLLIGGFNNTSRQRVHTGIPFLSHIPFLGRLFSRNGVYDDQRRLFFLLSAEIIDLGERESLR